MSLLIISVAIAFLVMGFVGLFKPAVLVSLFDGTAANVSVRNEVRAVYGGFGICIGILLLTISFALPEFESGVYFAVGVALAGMAIGRIISSLIEMPDYRLWLYMLFESIAALMLFSVAFA